MKYITWLVFILNLATVDNAEVSMLIHLVLLMALVISAAFWVISSQR